MTTNVAVRRDAFVQHGLFREDMRILEDTELYARMFDGGLPVGVIREPLAVRTMHEAQITRDYQTTFREAVMALDAGRPQPAQRRQRWRELVLETATFYLKECRPDEARRFLREQLGEEAWRCSCYRLTFVPSGMLALAKRLRRAALRLRYGALLSPEEYRRAESLIAPWLQQAREL